jgi:peptidoglycan hydrolase-like protein with peptidoglycan-binding domain
MRPRRRIATSMRRLAVALVILGAASGWSPSSAHATSVPILVPGDRGGEVATWQATLDFVFERQHRLNQPEVRAFLHRHGPLQQDGVFGPLTKHLTQLFQHVVGLPPTGAVGTPEWKWWIESQITCCGAGYPTLQEGEWSPYVGWWQISLNRWLSRNDPSSPKLIPDGVFGPLTNQATVTFQQAMGIGVDGIAGPESWHANRFLHLP